MMTMVEYNGTRFNLEIEPGANLTAVEEFLGSHLTFTTGETNDCLATLRITSTIAERHLPPPATFQEDVYVRKSANDFFSIPARRARHGNREFLECTKTGTRFIFDHDNAIIDIALGSNGAMDVIELIRDLVLKDQENTGAVVLHATAAYRDGTVVLITGSKGAGKSTILLELVEHFGYQILSGDKTVLHNQPDGSILAAGWPDYPHLGFGTIAKYPGLGDIAEIAENYHPPTDHAFSPFGKFAVDPINFRTRFPSAPIGTLAPVTAILHPNIGPGKQTHIEPVTENASDRSSLLNANVESTFDDSNAGWHHYLDDLRSLNTTTRTHVIAALADVPTWAVTGPGDLTENNLPSSIAHIKQIS